MSGLLNSDKVIEREKSLGLNDVVFPGPNELQLDFDSEDDYDRFRGELLNLLGEVHPFAQIVLDEPSKTSGHRHVVVQLECSLTPLTRLLLQACLGSDRKRELLGYINLQRGDQQPTLFIVPKNQKA